MKWFATSLALGLLAAPAAAQMRITEWMYQGGNGEFIEFTNVGTSAIDMTGWSFDDNSQTPGVTDLSAFGTVAPGASVILTETEATAFATAWSLSGVAIIGSNSNNLGRNDEINLYDAADALVDRLTYGDEDFAGTIRTQNKSGWTYSDFVGDNDVFKWFFSIAGDDQGTTTSALGDIGSPGSFGSVRAPRLNELGINDTGADDEEFIEVVGEPSAQLTNVMVLILEGDGTSAFGTLDRAFDLTGSTVPGDGYFVLGGGGAGLVGLVDFPIVNDAIENGTETVYVIRAHDPAAVTALVGMNLITGTDTSSVPTLGIVLDSVGVLSEDRYNPAELDAIFDGADEIAGADQKFGSPTAMYRGADFPGTWCGNFPGFDIVNGRTPGAANQACSAVNYSFPGPNCIATTGNAAGWAIRLQVDGDFTSTGTTNVRLWDSTTSDGFGNGTYILATGTATSVPLPLGCRLLVNHPGLNLIVLGPVTNVEADGTGSFSFSVVNPGVSGTGSLQAFVTTENGLGYTSSNGVTITLVP